jgi:outer membrane receptor protein involved in Fe transport
MVLDQYRLVGALYADLQYRPVRDLSLDVGLRLQEGFGGRPYDLTPLYTAALVWRIHRDVHLKLNYATGFRAPVFNTIDAKPGSLSFGANPNLKNETSQSFQGELNVRRVRSGRRIHELELRVDYSYTFLDQLIQIRGGIYGNSGQRSVHAVEAAGKMYASGDHVLTASYTFLYGVSSDVGVIRTVPNQWFTLGGSFNLFRKLLYLNVNLRVTGAYQDPNRVPTSSGGYPDATTNARTSDVTLDRLTPVALVDVGLQVHLLGDRLRVSAQAYNALNQRYYLVDMFGDLTPTVENTPQLAPGFSFLARATYRF